VEVGDRGQHGVDGGQGAFGDGLEVGAVVTDGVVLSEAIPGAYFR
jgi:hypothetical protein